ncbi:hypothetical protein BGX28_004983 [Mortierella sp. GBA30]|nr:hypothetical protein BGX28_004983 [Mortierella sp. GBA30]
MRKTGFISHIELSVADLEKSKKFYDFLLVDLLGYQKGYDGSDCATYILDTNVINLQPGNQTPHHKTNPGLHHLAFYAGAHDLVDEFYNKIVEFQELNNDFTASVILDKPALYPHYSKEEYYAVFFTDPSGIKLEILFAPSYPH